MAMAGACRVWDWDAEPDRRESDGLGWWFSNNHCHFASALLLTWRLLNAVCHSRGLAGGLPLPLRLDEVFSELLNWVL